MPIRDLSRPEPGLPKWRPKPRLKVFRSSSSWVPPRRIVILGEVILHLLFVIPVFGCLLRDKSMSGCECKPDRAQPSIREITIVTLLSLRSFFCFARLAPISVECAVTCPPCADFPEVFNE